MTNGWTTECWLDQPHTAIRISIRITGSDDAISITILSLSLVIRLPITISLTIALR